jgi:lipoprotein-anchoring transpeptidase ErfK/SrfK
MRRRIAVPIAAAAVLLLGASAAEAATLSVSGTKSCYRAGDTLTMSGTGYTPGGPVAVTLEGQDLGTTAADAAGNISAPIQIRQLRGVDQRALVATDATNPAITATTQFLGSALLVKVRPQNGTAGRKLRIRASGFTTGKRLYAHVLRKGYRRNVFIGKLKGPCHTLKVRKPVLTAATPNGRYRVQFDTRRRYSKKTKVFYSFRVTVT